MNQLLTSFQAFKQRYPIRPGDPAMLLGNGSYGRVVKVEDQLETEWVAIKISEFKGSDERSLRAEVELAQRVPRQANIARYDACYRLETEMGTSDFAIMKYYPDGNLADLLRQQLLTPMQITDLTRGILLGLQHLHNHRIVHRDFKPANILISRDNAGRLIPKIADFGLSKLVSDKELDQSDFDLSDGRGTPSYKAPEQIEGTRVSFNLDLWAFGVILFEMLAGEKPFQADAHDTSEPAVRRTIERKITSVLLPDKISRIDEPYQTIIRRCLVHDIHDRVRKADDLLDLLEDISGLLTTARLLVEQGDYTQALPLYEQVLARRDQQAEAVDGYAFCLNQLQSAGISTAMPGDATDLFQDDRTDIYIPARPDVIELPTDLAPSEQPLPVRRPALVRRLPWRVAVPVALGLGGLLVYQAFYQRPVQPNPIGSGQQAITQAGGGTFIAQPKAEETAALPLPATASEADRMVVLTKRVDVALGKARKAYADKKYADAIMLTNSALLLIPARKDVSELRAKALKAGGAAVEAVAQTAATPTMMAPEEPAPTPVTTAQPTESEKETKAEPNFQENYDQLIESGVKAIASGNNKAKAISQFAEAVDLAKQHNLNTTKADAAYAMYLTKASKIFENEEYQGAMDWYKVVQSLKDTPDVRTRIRQCANNL